MDLPLLSVLAPAEREVVAARLSRRRFRRGQVVFNDGDRGDCVHLVASGRFAVVASTASGVEIIVRIVHPGEYFGELALVRPDDRRTGRVIAFEPGETAVLRRRDFDSIRVDHPGVDRLLVTALAEQLTRMTEQSIEAQMPAEQRVWRRLLVLAQAYGDDPVRMSQSDLAQVAGTTRQTVNRAIATAEAVGAVRRERGAIRVVDAGIVQRLIDERRD